MSFHTAGPVPDVSCNIKVQELYDIHLQLFTTEPENRNIVPTTQNEPFD
jgi:hypothetical protein